MTANKPKNERITEIIAAAVEDFVEKGYDGASMNSIAARAGLSKGGLYHHFKCKADILLAANTEYMKPILALMETARSKSNPAKGLKTFINDHITYWKKHQKELVFTFLSLAEILSNRDMWPLMDTYAQEMIGFYAGMLEKGVKGGFLRAHDVQGRALTLFAALDGVSGYTVMCRSLPTPKIVDRFINVYIRDIEI